MIIHNCHVHTFTGRAVPAEFLPLGLVRVLSRRRCSRLFGRFLNWLNPFSSRDLFDRYGAFVEIGGSRSQREIFERLLGYYPEGTRFVVLMMDMEYMDVGEVAQPFEEQLDRSATRRWTVARPSRP